MATKKTCGFLRKFSLPQQGSTQASLGEFIWWLSNLCLSMLKGCSTLEGGMMSGDNLFPSLPNDSKVPRSVQPHLSISSYELLVKFSNV